MSYHAFELLSGGHYLKQRGDRVLSSACITTGIYNKLAERCDERLGPLESRQDEETSCQNVANVCDGEAAIRAARAIKS